MNPTATLDADPREERARPVPVPGAAVGDGRGGRRAMWGAAGAYLLLSVGVWAGVWTSHPAGTTTCGCGDSALFLWFLNWPAYAIAHGHNPFYSSLLVAPRGINLLANTSETGLGILLAPVTWLFGPVTTFNVAITLAPASSALSMYWLLTRWVERRLAAFAGGLAFGFSPFVLTGLTDGHLMIGMLALVPLIVGWLHEAVVRHRYRPVTSGVVLGVLVALQFFVGTEMLAILALVVAVGMLLALGYVVVADRPRLREHAATGGVALAVGSLVAGALLAYPAWFALKGPAHLPTLVWGEVLSTAGAPLASMVWPVYDTLAWVRLQHSVGGYQGSALPDGALVGIGIAAAALVAVLTSLRRPLVWLLAVTTAISVWLAVGMGWTGPSVWTWLNHLPLFGNVIPARFVALVVAGGAALLAVAADGCARWAGARLEGRRGRVLAAVALVAVSLGGLLPELLPLAGNLPFTTQHVVVPRWFTSPHPQLHAGEVVMAEPVPTGWYQSAMAWQAVSGSPYALVGGGGPSGAPALFGRDRDAAKLLSDGNGTVGAAQLTGVHRALAAWRVRVVVMPVDPALQVYARDPDPAWVSAVVTAATGVRPTFVDDAWEWDLPPGAGTPVAGAAPSLESCIGGASGAEAVAQVAVCVASGGGA